MRTLPEQIADDLGGRIASGSLAAGDRLLEVEIAARYGVSRAPVREAIRLLARRGFVDFYPRRGAFVVDFTSEKVADIFNIVGVLNGLAGRYFATRASDAEIAELDAITRKVDACASDPACDGPTFTACSSVLTHYYTSRCGSSEVAAILHHHTNETAWGTLWRTTSRDFATPERRREAADLYNARQAAFIRRDGDAAEAYSRQAAALARDEAIKNLERLRGETRKVRAR